MERAQGYLVAAWEETPSAGPRRADAPRRIFLTGRLDDRRSFAAVLRAPSPALYVAHEHGPAAHAKLAGAALDPEPWSDLAGASLARLEVVALDRAERALAAAHVPVLAREWPRA